MNHINFNQSVGFPLETEILAEMQKAYTLLNALGAIAGDKAIISGCELTNTTVSDGVIYLNGEILEFKGGTLDTHIIIVETKTALEFEDTITRDVVYMRYATFGTATTQWDWVDFKRGFPTVNIETALASKATVQALNTLSATVATAVTKLSGIENNAQKNVKADWNATTGDSEILNKPPIGSPFLHKGIVTIGDILNPDVLLTVNMPNIGTSSYMVLGSFKSNHSDWTNDNDIAWSWRSPTNTSFQLLLREISDPVQNIEFYYVIIPLS